MYSENVIFVFYINVTDVKNCTNIPVLIGSGITAANVHEYFEADAVIVGTHFKDNER